jgi:hypothetical protein
VTEEMWEWRQLVEAKQSTWQPAVCVHNPAVGQLCQRQCAQPSFGHRDNSGTVAAYTACAAEHVQRQMKEENTRFIA